MALISPHLNLIGHDSWRLSPIDQLKLLRAKLELHQQVRQRVEDRLLETLATLGNAEAAYRGWPELVSYRSERTREHVRRWELRQAAGESWPAAPTSPRADTEIVASLTPDVLQCASCRRQASVALWQARGSCPVCGGPGYMPTGTRSRPAAPPPPPPVERTLSDLRRVALQAVTDMTAAEQEMAALEERKVAVLRQVRGIFEELRACKQTEAALQQDRARLQQELFASMTLSDGTRQLEDDESRALSTMEQNDVPQLI